MGTHRRMSGSFKRGSLKSSTSGSQKVSELRGGPWVASPSVSERWAVAPVLPGLWQAGTGCRGF